VARDLLGQILVRVDDGRRMSGRIVETEAYRGLRDPASHAYVGRTKRNNLMFGEPGRAYVYLSYGVNWCLNLTTEPVGTPGAVLIRAIEPLEGASLMMKNRGRPGLSHLADGPGKLTQALAIDGGYNSEDLITSDRLFVEAGRREGKVTVGPRIGISKGIRLQWRFLEEHPLAEPITTASQA
jgi:DNA-3-methyladenine glycosylase